MNKFIAHSILFLVILLLSIGGMITFIPMEKNNYLYMLNIKDSLLRETPSPRLVLISGSSFAFGVDSRMLQDSLGLNVVNMGLHAGLGLKYIMDDAMRYLRKGDVVVIGLEHEQLRWMMYGDDATLGPGMYYTSYKNIKLLNGIQMKNAIVGIPTAIRMNWKSRKLRQQKVYSARAFNEWGDEAGHREDTIQHPLSKLPRKIGLINPEYAQCFVERLMQMEEIGCKVIITPSPMWDDVPVKQIGEEINEFLETTQFRLNASFERHLYPADMMYDSHYHLNDKGVRNFTKNLIDELKQEL